MKLPHEVAISSQEVVKSSLEVAISSREVAISSLEVSVVAGSRGIVRSNVEIDKVHNHIIIRYMYYSVTESPLSHILR